MTARRASARLIAAMLVAAGLGGAARAELSVEEILRVLPGTWEVDTSELADGAETTTLCDESPVQISITETDDGYVYESVYPGEAESSRRAPIRIRPNAILIQYDGEQRLDPAGRHVEWYLLMPDRDRYYWVRADWLASQPGGRTAMFRRCVGPIA